MAAAVHPEVIDEELLAATATDAEAFGRFYDRHSEDVLQFFYRRTDDRHSAADLMAETFAEALRSAHRYRPSKGPARGWLFGIAKNVLSHYQRHQRVRDRSLRRLGIPPISHEDMNLDRIDSLVDALGQRSQLAAGLAQLPASLADAVVLRVGKNLEFSEVAEELGCSVGAARVRVSRGLTHLAEVIDV